MAVRPPRPSPSRALAGSGAPSAWSAPGQGWRRRRRRLSARLLARRRCPQAGSRALEAVRRPVVPDSGPRAPPLGRPAAGGGGRRGRGAGRSEWAGGVRTTPEACAPPPRLIGGRAGGRGAGTWRAGRGGARRTKTVLRAPARAPLGPGGSAVFAEAGPWTGLRAREPRGVREACPLGGTWGALAPDWAREPGAWVQIPAPPPDLGVLVCIMGTWPRKRMWSAWPLQACRLAH